MEKSSMCAVNITPLVSSISGKKMREQMEAMKNITIIEPIVTVESTVKAKTIEDLKVLADALLA